MIDGKDSEVVVPLCVQADEIKEAIENTESMDFYSQFGRSIIECKCISYK